MITVAIAGRGGRGTRPGGFVAVDPLGSGGPRHRGSDEVRRIGSLACVDLVGAAVAVVVDAVAQFGASTGQRGAVCLDRTADDAGAAIAKEGACRATSAITGVWIGIIAGAGFAEVRDVLVKLAIAVVVEHVAGFVVRRAAAGADARGERALPCAGYAGDGNTRRAFRTRRGGTYAADLNGRGFDDAFVDHAVAVVVLAVAGFLRAQEGTRVFTRVVAIKVVVAVLAALEDAHACGAAPDREHRARVAVVAARAAVCHVRLQIGLSGQRTITVRIDAARVD